MKRFALRLLRILGGFALARWLTRRGLRIICYHGVALGDEARFRPHLFIERAQLERRLNYLLQNDFPVLSLDEALLRLERGDLPPRATVITFDDGFYSVLAAGLPLLQKHGMPATLYVSTYYVEQQIPVCNLAIPYLFWKARAGIVDLSALTLSPEVARPHHWDQLTSHARDTLVEAVTTAGESTAPLGRLQLIRDIATRVGLDPERFISARQFSFVNATEIAKLQDNGIAIELHTHRHRSPGTRDASEAEIRNNQAVIERILGRHSRHFCYPSGRDDRWEDEWLTGCGIVSATVTRAGFNYRETPRLRLRRFLDSSEISQLDFEAELSGVLELARRVRTALGERG